MSLLRAPGLAALLLLAAAGCGTGSPSRDPPSRLDADRLSAQHLLRHSVQSPRTLDPALNVDVSAQRIIDDLFEGLTRVDAAGAVVPAVAERWEISADGLRWTFHLRSGLTWSDGTPLTAADFLFGWRRVVDPATASESAQQLAPIENGLAVAKGTLPVDALGVSAPDPLTLEVKLVSPVPFLPYLLTNNFFYPQPAAAIARHGRAWTQPENLVGNGAFVLESSRVNGAVVLAANPRYREASKVRLRRVTYFPLPDFNAVTARFLAGDMDLTDGFLVDDLDWLAARVGEDVRLAPYLGTVMLGFNVRKPPFDSAPLREALTLAVDRGVIASKLLRGRYAAAESMVAPMPGYPGVAPKWAALTQPEREARARRLYAQAGYSVDRPLTVEMNFPNITPDTRRILEACTAMWRAVLGADVRLTNQEWRVFQQERRLGKFALFWDSWIGDYPDPSTFLTMLQRDNGQNVGGFDDPRFEAALAEATATLDPNARMRAFAQAEAIVNDAVAVLPLYYYRSRHLLRPYVAGWEDNVVDRHLSRDLWLENPESP
jgi:oligopeptide transport system substrate-binding protein